VVVVCEFFKQEVVMAEITRMADEAKKIGQQAQEGAQRAGREFQAAEGGFEAASRSFTEANKGLEALASEMTDFSKKRFEDLFRAWEQLLRARSLPDVIEVQTQYAQRAYEAYTSEMSKLGEMYLGTVRSASKPVEESSRRLR